MKWKSKKALVIAILLTIIRSTWSQCSSVCDEKENCGCLSRLVKRLTRDTAKQPNIKVPKRLAVNETKTTIDQDSSVENKTFQKRLKTPPTQPFQGQIEEGKTIIETTPDEIKQIAPNTTAKVEEGTGETENATFSVQNTTSGETDKMASNVENKRNVHVSMVVKSHTKTTFWWFSTTPRTTITRPFKREITAEQTTVPTTPEQAKQIPPNHTIKVENETLINSQNATAKVIVKRQNKNSTADGSLPEADNDFASVKEKRQMPIFPSNPVKTIQQKPNEQERYYLLTKKIENTTSENTEKTKVENLQSNINIPKIPAVNVTKTTIDQNSSEEEKTLRKRPKTHRIRVGKRRPKHKKGKKTIKTTTEQAGQIAPNETAKVENKNVNSTPDSSPYKADNVFAPVKQKRQTPIFPLDTLRITNQELPYKKTENSAFINETENLAPANVENVTMGNIADNASASVRVKRQGPILPLNPGRIIKQNPGDQELSNRSTKKTENGNVFVQNSSINENKNVAPANLKELTLENSADNATASTPERIIQEQPNIQELSNKTENATFLVYNSTSDLTTLNKTTKFENVTLENKNTTAKIIVKRQDTNSTVDGILDKAGDASVSARKKRQSPIFPLNPVKILQEKPVLKELPDISTKEIENATFFIQNSTLAQTEPTASNETAEVKNVTLENAKNETAKTIVKRQDLPCFDEVDSDSASVKEKRQAPIFPLVPVKLILEKPNIQEKSNMSPNQIENANIFVQNSTPKAIELETLKVQNVTLESSKNQTDSSLDKADNAFASGRLVRQSPLFPYIPIEIRETNPDLPEISNITNGKIKTAIQKQPLMLAGEDGEGHIKTFKTHIQDCNDSDSPECFHHTGVANISVTQTRLNAGAHNQTEPNTLCCNNSSGKMDNCIDCGKETFNISGRREDTRTIIVSNGDDCNDMEKCGNDPAGGLTNVNIVINGRKKREAKKETPPPRRNIQKAILRRRPPTPPPRKRPRPQVLRRPQRPKLKQKSHHNGKRGILSESPTFPKHIVTDFDVNYVHLLPNGSRQDQENKAAKNDRRIKRSTFVEYPPPIFNYFDDAPLTTTSPDLEEGKSSLTDLDHINDFLKFDFLKGSTTLPDPDKGKSSLTDLNHINEIFKDFLEGSSTEAIPVGYPDISLKLMHSEVMKVIDQSETDKIRTEDFPTVIDIAVNNNDTKELKNPLPQIIALTCKCSLDQGPLITLIPQDTPDTVRDLICSSFCSRLAEAGMKLVCHDPEEWGNIEKSLLFPSSKTLKETERQTAICSFVLEMNTCSPRYFLTWMKISFSYTIVSIIIMILTIVMSICIIRRFRNIKIRKETQEKKISMYKEVIKQLVKAKPHARAYVMSK